VAKQGGLGDNLYVAGYNASGDVGQLSSIHGGPKPLDVTGIDKSASERIGGQRDGDIQFQVFFNPTVGLTHDKFAALPTADVIATYCRGTTLGNPAACCVAKQINYDGKRANDGAFTFDISVLANGFGLEWGLQLTAGQRTDGSATNGTAVDQVTVSTAFGWQAYLHVFAFTGTSVTVKVQDSADNSAYTDLAGAGFTAATGVTSQRLAGGATDTVRRYVRAVTTGTFSNAIFSVTFVRNLTAVTF